MKVNATLWNLKKDHEGEVTLSVKIPSSDGKFAMTIPEDKNLVLDITEGYIEDNNPR